VAVIQPRDVYRVRESFAPKDLGALDTRHGGFLLKPKVFNLAGKWLQRVDFAA
jgi:hypothetical protein